MFFIITKFILQLFYLLWIYNLEFNIKGKLDAKLFTNAAENRNRPVSHQYHSCSNYPTIVAVLADLTTSAVS